VSPVSPPVVLAEVVRSGFVEGAHLLGGLRHVALWRVPHQNALRLALRKALFQKRVGRGQGQRAARQRQGRGVEACDESRVGRERVGVPVVQLAGLDQQQVARLQRMNLLFNAPLPAPLGDVDNLEGFVDVQRQRMRGQAARFVNVRESGELRQRVTVRVKMPDARFGLRAVDALRHRKPRHEGRMEKR